MGQADIDVYTFSTRVYTGMCSCNVCIPTTFTTFTVCIVNNRADNFANFGKNEFLLFTFLKSKISWYF